MTLYDMIGVGLICLGVGLVLWLAVSYRKRAIQREIEEQRRNDKLRQELFKDNVERLASYARGYPAPVPPPPKRSGQRPAQANPAPRSKASDDDAPAWPNTSFQQAYTRASDPDPAPNWSGGGGSSGGGGASGSWGDSSSSSSSSYSSSDSGSSSSGGGSE